MDDADVEEVTQIVEEAVTRNLGAMVVGVSMVLQDLVRTLISAGAVRADELDSQLALSEQSAARDERMALGLEIVRAVRVATEVE